MMISREKMQRRRQVILDLLAARPASIHEIAAAIRLTKQNAQKHMNRLRAEPGIVHIAVWHRGGHDDRKYPRPYYALGSEPDAPKPPPIHKPWARRAKSKAAATPKQKVAGPFAALFK